MVISSPCLIDIKNWLVQSKRLLALASPKKTAIGKDFSNPLIVDSSRKPAFVRIAVDTSMETQEKELILLMVKVADLEIRIMELENSQNNALAKLPMLKLGEYEMWEIRIKQYFQIQDYALWEVIENGNSWVPIPVTAPESGPSTALKMTVPSTAEEKICKIRFYMSAVILFSIHSDEWKSFHSQPQTALREDYYPVDELELHNSAKRKYEAIWPNKVELNDVYESETKANESETDVNENINLGNVLVDEGNTFKELDVDVTLFQGIILALAAVFSMAKQRYCLRHIHENVKLQWNGRAFKDHLWRCPTTTTVQQYDRSMFDFKALLNLPINGIDTPNPKVNVTFFRIVNAGNVIEKCNGPLTPAAQHMLDLIKKEIVNSKRLKKNVDYEQLIDFLAMDKSMLEEELSEDDLDALAFETDGKEGLAFEADDPEALVFLPPDLENLYSWMSSSVKSSYHFSKCLDGPLLDTMYRELYMISSELLVSKEEGP
ncbi:hypothetical protein Tco_1494231 [Tanacetum coccineum]